MEQEEADAARKERLQKLIIRARKRNVEQLA
jgi:hypothetical protein